MVSYPVDHDFEENSALFERLSEDFFLHPEVEAKVDESREAASGGSSDTQLLEEHHTETLREDLQHCSYSPPPPFFPMPPMRTVCNAALCNHSVKEQHRNGVDTRKDNLLSKETCKQRYFEAPSCAETPKVLQELAIRYSKAWHFDTREVCRVPVCPCDHTHRVLQKTLQIFPKQFLRVRRLIIEFAFSRLDQLGPKVQIDVLFSAIEIFDAYSKQQLKYGENQLVSSLSSAKSLFLGALVLASKMENVRHLSLKACCETCQVSPSMRKNILECERMLFITLNPRLTSPSAYAFVGALLGGGEAPKEIGVGNQSSSCSNPTAYYLAVYILALNILDPQSLTLTAEVLGNACAWVVVLLLRLPLTPTLKRLAVIAASRQYCRTCQHVMKRALRGCQSPSNPINRFFAAKARHRATDMICLAARTAVGNVFLSL